VLNFANADSGGIGSFLSTPNNAKADYGRASYDVRSRVFMGGSYTAKYLISISPLLQVQSGSPFNITSGTDVYGDNQYNNRAVALPAGSITYNVTTTNPITLQPQTTTYYAKTIPNCGTFGTPGFTAGGVTYNTPVAINKCTGPANWVANLRVVKTIGFGGMRATPRPDRGGGQGGGNRPPPGMGGGAPGGGGARGGGGAGGGGFGGGGGASTGQKYNLTFGFQAFNLFNIYDRGAPVGTISSPSFGTVDSLAGGQYTTNSAVRRITLQAGFTF